MSKPECPKRLVPARPAGAPVTPADFHDVQRIVLHGTRWSAARHLMLSFGDRSSTLRFLQGLLDRITPAEGTTPELQFSLGFTRRGLERADVPKHVLANFALKAPAFWAGAALRAADHLAMSDRNAPERWDRCFRSLDAVLSVHAKLASKEVGDVHAKQARREFDEVLANLAASAKDNGLTCEELPPAANMEVPAELLPDENQRKRSQWVHFGFRDGLSLIGIEGWTPEERLKKCLPISRHQPGEFVLGYLQDCGADPWIAGPRLRVWPNQLRAFFHNGSFGVLQQVEQNVPAFEQFVKEAAERSKLSPREIKGKLCGRYPDGQPLAVSKAVDPRDDFDYRTDHQGYGCPFGSHVRRMNPRLPRPDDRKDGEHGSEDKLGPDERPAHFSRARPLLRRGMPYGPQLPSESEGGAKGSEPRGLIGQFFCASIEDQYEHLLGEWGERVPMGSPDGGGARDPLFGDHETGDGPFEIPRAAPPALRLGGLTPFTRTMGVAYLFYPSLTTLACIADSSRWGLDDREDDDLDHDE